MQPPRQRMRSQPLTFAVPLSVWKHAEPCRKRKRGRRSLGGPSCSRNATRLARPMPSGRACARPGPAAKPRTASACRHALARAGLVMRQVLVLHASAERAVDDHMVDEHKRQAHARDGWVIHMSVRSDDAALIAVMAGPTLSAEAITKFGNIEAANSSTSSAHDADCATNAPRSSVLLLREEHRRDHSDHEQGAKSQRTTPSAGSIGA